MPKTTDEIYRELLAKGDAAQQQANELLTQYDSRPAFSYNADTDPIYQSVRDQYVHQGRRAMEDTMGQAAGLTGGYGSSYSQSVGNQAYNEYLTKLNAQIPVLAQQARQAYDAEGDRLLNRYNLAQNAANTAYGQSRDALGDLRYEDELNYNRQQSELNSARDYATYLLGMGIMPSAQQLAAAGMTPQEASAIQAYYRNQMALASGSGSRSTSSNPGRTPGGGDPITDPKANETELEIGQGELNEILNTAANMGGDQGLAWLQSEFEKRFPDSKYSNSNKEAAWNWLAMAFEQRRGRSGSSHGGTGNGRVAVNTIS